MSLVKTDVRENLYRYEVDILFSIQINDCTTWYDWYSKNKDGDVQHNEQVNYC